jgi:aspartyl-tRNA synthetase
MRTPIAKVTPELDRAKIVGFVHEVRDLGGLTFVLLRDRTGILQVTVPKKKVPPEVAEAVRSVSRESVVVVTGVVKATEKAPGGRELVPSSFEVVSRAETPLPLDVAEKVPAELDTRLDARFLDARRPRVTAIFQVRSAVLHETSRYLHKHDFIQITTPKIVAAATEGGTELFPIAYFEKEAFLNQSPQLYKQMMIGAGFEKVFEIGPIFRAEEHNTTRHLNEATSIDAEVAFADHEDVMTLLEGLVVSCYEHVTATCADALERGGFPELAVPRAPFPRLPYAEAIECAAGRIEEPIGFGDDLSPGAERAIGDEMGEHYFVTDWPTSIRAYYALLYEDDPSICRAFDLMHPRMELSSGAQRVHRHDMLEQQLVAKGLDPASFEFYLRPFRYGMPPHAGWGLGVERFVMTMLDLPNIREAVLFPRDRHRLMP